VVVRNNVIDTVLGSGQGIALVRPIPANWRGKNTHLGTATLTVIEHNKIVNAPIGVALNGAMDPDVLIYKNIFDAGTFANRAPIPILYANPTQAVHLRGNTYKNFTTNYLDP
jgi:hypothetical protein